MIAHFSLLAVVCVICWQMFYIGSIWVLHHVGILQVCFTSILHVFYVLCLDDVMVATSSFLEVASRVCFISILHAFHMHSTLWQHFEFCFTALVHIMF